MYSSRAGCVLCRNTVSLTLVGLLFAFAIGSGGCSNRSRKEPLNTIHWPQPQKIRTLDPIYADDIYSAEEVTRGYETLLQYHFLKRPYVLVSNLAESLPEVNADGKIHVFRLKKGVLFQDDRCFKQTGGKGREMTAEDLVYSLKRLADPKLISTGWWLLDGKIEGLNEWRELARKNGADYGRDVVGLRATDRYTVEIRLVRRSSSFLYSLAMPFTSIVAREAVEFYGKEFGARAVGTGPFRLLEFTSNSRLVWARNPTYRKELYPSEGSAEDKAAGFLEDAGKSLPLADRIVVQVYEEWHPMWLAFLSGGLAATFIPKDGFAQAITPRKELSLELKEKGIRLSRSPYLDLTHLTLNMSDPLLGKNKLLRQALSLAYDEDKFDQLFFNGRTIAAQGPIPPGLEGYDPGFKNPYRQFNLAKAKDYLARAGYPDGKGLPPLVYVTASDATSRQIADFDSHVFAAIGVKLQVESYSWPEFQASIRNRKGQIWPFAWVADYPDPENFLQLFYSKNASPGPNDSNYSNPEFDRLYEKAIATPQGPERTALYKEMVKLVIEDCPWIFKAHRIGYRVSQKWLKNYKYHDFHGAAKYYRVEDRKN